MHVGVVRFETEGLLILPHCCRYLILILEGNAQVVVRLGEVGFEADGFLIMAYRLGQPASRLQSITQIAVEGGIPRLERDRPADVLDRYIVLAHLVGDHAQQMPGVGMIRIHLQDLAIDRFGLLQVAQLMVLHCQGQSFGNRCHKISFQFSVFSQIVSGGLRRSAPKTSRRG